MNLMQKNDLGNAKRLLRAKKVYSLTVQSVFEIS